MPSEIAAGLGVSKQLVSYWAVKANIPWEARRKAWLELCIKHATIHIEGESSNGLQENRGKNSTR